VKYLVTGAAGFIGKFLTESLFSTVSSNDI
jgi:nucleoside-diphosphate-sugar epimerase